MDFLAKALDALLEKAVSYGDVWVTSLDDIARWWQDRATFSFEMVETHPCIYDVAIHCNFRASVALQYPGGKMEFIKPGENGTFSVHTNLRPVVGISSASPDKDARFLANEGFAVEADADPSGCAFTLDNGRSRSGRQLMDALKEARGPLLRFWRWPDRFVSALAITADVDAITLFDFVRRARHFLRTKTGP